jgi:hypothetical protein
MRWILDNKTWLFSGIGVLAITAITWVLGLIFRRRAAQPSAQTSAVAGSSMIASPVVTGSNNIISVVAPQPAQMLAPQPAQKPDEYSPRPTPQEIYSEVRTHPTFQQQAAAKAYAGIKVCWQGTFYTIDDVRTYIGLTKPDNGATHFVLLATPSASLIKVPVNIERLPRLKVTHIGTPMEVRGVIAEVGPAIELRDATLSYVD